PLYNGCMVNDMQMLPGHGTRFGEVLRDSGYHTGYIGKWHIYGGNRERGVPPGPLRYGFDHEFFTNNCDLNFWADSAFYYNDEGKRVKLGKFESDGHTDQALKFLDQHAGEKPFALFLSLHPPHNWGHGYPAREEYTKRYDPATIKLRPGTPDRPGIRSDYQGYMALCTDVDDNVGRLLDKLNEKGIANNTIVVFTSDHGDILKSHNVMDWKKSRPEHVSSRVPLIVRWPGVLGARVSETVMGTLDLMPTVLGLMGLAVPESCQGINHAMALKADKDGKADSVPMFFWGCGSDWRGVYTSRYTYSFEPPGATKGINVLYDRQEDPHEVNNLFNSPDHQELRKTMHALTLKWMAKFHDKHVPWHKLKHHIYVEPAAAKAEWEPMWVESAALKGRPVDLIGELKIEN
ncbi:MAG: sulfatase-like hydrolase/transferase, partial [Verrucomicrobia bacterium]|nr:sulfatase-like hydrolase/transferase [Verrucomicrobiota bacterium]